MKTEIKALGHSAFEIIIGGENMLIDPWLNDNPVSPMKAKDFNKVNLIAATHGHFDHFGDSMEILRNTDAKCVCTTIVSWYLHLRGITKESGRNLALSQGGTITVGNIRVSMVNAVHTTALFADEWPLLREYFPDGGAVGYVVSSPGGPAIYHAGDTDIFMDMQLIGRKYRPAVAILPIGGRFTMDIESAVMACDLLKPKIVVPMHYNTNPFIQCNVDDFVRLMSQEHPDVRVEVMAPGQVFTVTA